jgi:hypothetical protein
MSIRTTATEVGGVLGATEAGDCGCAAGREAVDVWAWAGYSVSGIGPPIVVDGRVSP